MRIAAVSLNKKIYCESRHTICKKLGARKRIQRGKLFSFSWLVYLLFTVYPIFRGAEVEKEQRGSQGGEPVGWTITTMGTRSPCSREKIRRSSGVTMARNWVKLDTIQPLRDSQYLFLHEKAMKVLHKLCSTFQLLTKKGAKGEALQKAEFYRLQGLKNSWHVLIMYCWWRLRNHRWPQ